MEYQSDEREHGEHNGPAARSFLAGVLIGGLAAAGTMLLLAPQSGKQTRDQIRQKGLQLRDQATETVEDAVAQTRARAEQITAGVREKAGELQQRGQEMLDEKKERWSPVIAAGKKAAAGSEG